MTTITPTIASNRIDNPCTDCPLQGGSPKLRPKGNRQARFLVVTNSPDTRGYARQNRYFNAEAERVWHQAAKDAGFGKDDFAYTSYVKCSYDSDTFNAANRQTIWRHCREHFLRVVEDVNPEVVICLGADAARTVYGKAKKIGKVRGLIEESSELDCKIYSMYDPNYVVNYPQHWGVLRADFQTLGRLDDSDFDQEEATAGMLGDYEIIDDLQFLIDQRPTEIALDTETEGLRWQIPEKRLLTIQISIEAGKGYLISWDHPDAPASRGTKRKLRRQLRELLCRPEVEIVGHNAKYDALWLFTRTGVRIRIYHDTLMMAALHDENNNNKDLSTLVKMHVPELAGYDDVFNQKYDKSHMEKVPLTEIRDYGCGDSDATFRLRDFFLPIIESDPQLLNNYRTVSMPALNAFVPIEMRGLLCDEQKLSDLESNLQDHVLELERSLLEQVPRSIKRKHIEKGLKFSRADFLRDILFLHRDGFRLRPRQYTKGTMKLAPSERVPSTSSKTHLPYFFEECPFAEMLAEYKKLEHLLGTNIVKFRENYMLGDMVYPTYQLHVAVTGRTASRDPNGQNFPKRGLFAKQYRKIFIPPPGYISLEADLSQAELRIAADMSRDPTMIQIYNSGGDIHVTTALIVSGLSMQQYLVLPQDERDLLRFKAKAVNFGFLYGMGWRTFIVYAKTQYGADFTIEEAQRIRNGFFDTYSNLSSWHRAMREFVRENGFVRSYSGRVRHLPTIYSREEYIRKEAERQAINSPVQEFGSTLGLMALTAMEAEVDSQYLAINGFIHDAIKAIAPLEYAEWAAKTMKYYMERIDVNEVFGIQMQVPILADVTMGMSGGDLYELKDLDLYEPYDFDALRLPYSMPAQLNPVNDGLIEQEEYLRMAA